MVLEKYAFRDVMQTGFEKRIVLRNERNVIKILNKVLIYDVTMIVKSQNDADAKSFGLDCNAYNTTCLMQYFRWRGNAQANANFAISIVTCHHSDLNLNGLITSLACYS